MTTDRAQILQDYLDGLLPPARAAEVEALVREDPAWSREHREMVSVLSLLDTPIDVEPPADLESRIFAAIAADASRRRFRIPVRVERALVLAGAAGVAAFVAGVGRVLGPVEPAGWVGRLVVAATSGLGRFTETVVSTGATLGQLDWVARLLGTLSGAGRTVLASSAEPILALAVVALASGAVLAWMLMRAERSRQGGLPHVHLV